MKTIEDLKTFLIENNAFKDSEFKTLGSGITRKIKNNKELLRTFQSVLNLSTEDPAELIYNVINPNCNKTCLICGKSTTFDKYYNGYRKACCKKCADELTVQKGRKTKLEKYGSSNYNNSKKNQQTKLERYGNAFYTNIEKGRKTKELKYGYSGYNNIEKGLQTKLEKYGNSSYNNFEKAILTNLEKRGVKYPAQDEDVRQKQRKNSHKKYLYKDKYFDSSWELAFYITNTDLGHCLIQEPCSFPYEVENNVFYYYPDFSLNSALYEIKGQMLISDEGVWIPPKEELREDLTQEEINFLYKKYAEKQRCAIKNNVIILTKESIKPYLDYCKQKFKRSTWSDSFKINPKSKIYTSFLFNRGIQYIIQEEDLNLKEKDFYKKVLPCYDLEIDALLKSRGSFPYPSYKKEDLKKEFISLKETKKINRLGDKILRHFHPSIYEAHVKNCKSPKEAWNDEELMKRVIENRMIYSKKLEPRNFLDALSVMHLAPRVSLFSASLSKHLIETYLNEFNTIFDPFSGFSGRLLGTCALNKKYIGQDINPDHVKESNEIIKFLNLDAQVTIKDVLESQGEYDCLFTCSPYGGKEHWNVLNDEVEKSCDEWIDECLNRFKCKKYLFVVDQTEKYKDKIVETLTNRSHFGSNNEYVILI